MPKLRRFHVQSLSAVKCGDAVHFSPEECKHIRVLRLASGSSIQVFDDEGRAASGCLVSATVGNSATASVVGGESEYQVKIDTVSVNANTDDDDEVRLILAVAWPKGKRAAVLVEKCTELGVHCIIPVRYDRSVVSKSEHSEGLVRLQRIALESAKQCGRNDVPEINPERTFKQLLEEHEPRSFILLLDPRGDQNLAELLRDFRLDHTHHSVLLLVGPEGGFSSEELDAVRQLQIPRVRIAKNVLRVETAALSACAIAQAVFNSII